MTRLHRGEQGFTVIELVIMVAIMGAIAAIVIANLTTFVGSGVLAAANNEADVVRTAVDAYKVDNNGTIPSGSYGAGNKGVLEPYIYKALIGTYEVATDGTVSGTGGWSSLQWNDTKGMWERRTTPEE